MLYLLLSILFSTSLVLLFKAFSKYNTDNLALIVVNYYVAALIGFIVNNNEVIPAEVIQRDWFFNAVIIGVVFFVLFNIIAYTTQKIGISVATVANKMSLVIPATAAVFLYGDEMNLIKITGILIAIAAVWLTSKKNISGIPARGMFLFPLVIFIGSGFIDAFFKFTESQYLSVEEIYIFIPVLFSIAAITGTTAFVFRSVKSGLNFTAASFVCGIILGIPNYFSVYYLIKTLKIENLQSSVIFPVNNIGIVTLSVLFALLIFKEKISLINWIGIGLSVVAVALIANG